MWLAEDALCVDSLHSKLLDIFIVKSTQLWRGACFLSSSACLRFYHKPRETICQPSTKGDGGTRTRPFLPASVREVMQEVLTTRTERHFNHRGCGTFSLWVWKTGPVTLILPWLRRDLSAEFLCLGCCFGLKMPGAKDAVSLEEGLLSMREILGVSPSTWEVGQNHQKFKVIHPCINRKFEASRDYLRPCL